MYTADYLVKVFTRFSRILCSFAFKGSFCRVDGLNVSSGASGEKYVHNGGEQVCMYYVHE